MAAGSVHIPWYATGFRADQLDAALREIAPLARVFGATEWKVYRNRDDRYKFLQTATFLDKLDWERYWASEEFTHWRAIHQGMYQIPVLYTWADEIVSGTAPPPADKRGATTAGAVGDVV
jgi:hypothetical protein